jgi:mono/diheme cytochrome c family protein
MFAVSCAVLAYSAKPPQQEALRRAAAQEPDAASARAPAAGPTFYRHVLPILQAHCQECHHAGGSAQPALETYEEVRRYARDIRQAVQQKTMPPWFADPRFGRFANDPSLTADQIATLAAWAAGGSPAGDQRDAPPAPRWPGGWAIPEPDRVVTMPVPVGIPAEGEIEYTYEIVPTGFTEGRWVQTAELRPSSAEYVHHAVIYVRPPGARWLRHAPVGTAFTASTLTDAQDRHDAHGTDSDMLLVYAPGSRPERWPEGMAHFVPAGSDLVFQMHYTTNGRAGADQTKVGLVFAKTQPKQRVITLQLTNSTFVIPPGADNYRVTAHGTLPGDATLLAFFPHMHLRGKRFEYNILHRDGSIETLLRVEYHFHWQMSYRLAEPRALSAGTVLQAVAWYDNSKKNPHNPDPEAAVRWGDHTDDEMMVGFFDVAIPAGMDKWKFFEQRKQGSEPQFGAAR